MIIPNPFVYEQTFVSDIKSPTIPSILEEQYSQCGEDLIVLSLLRAMQTAEKIGCLSDYICVEIGANHGFAGSNTYLIRKELGVRCLLVEANPKLINDLIKSRPQDSVIHAAIVNDDRENVDLFVSAHHELSSLHKGFVENWHQGQVGVEEVITVSALRINCFFDQYVPNAKKILFLSVDIEGMDLEIVEGIDFNKWRPMILQMEPSEHYLEGESKKMVEFMQSRGYFLFAQTKVNLLFVDRCFFVEYMFECQKKIDNDLVDSGLSNNKSSIDVKEAVCHNPRQTDTVVAQPSPVVQSNVKGNSLFESVHDSRAVVNGLLAQWIVDTEFVESALKQATGAGVLSLDIFDTALTRHFDSPVDVFAEVEKRLYEFFGPSAKGFALAREQAERNARNRLFMTHNAEEVAFHDIYSELPALLPKFNEWEAASALELVVERESLYAVPDILELTRRLKKSGTPYIFVSDMYLPSSFLSEVLREAGYEGWERIYVSSEFQSTKATGRIWEVVAKDYSLKKVLHIGDDMHSDVNGPRGRGVATFEYGRAKSERRVGAKMNPAVLPFSRLQRKIELSSRRQPGKTRTSQEAWYDLGHSLGGIVVGTFVRWLAERVTLHKIDRLYFCARDGYLIKRAWEAAGFDKSVPVEIHYIYVSRAVLNIPSGIQESSRHALSQSLLNFLSSSTGNTTVREALDRAALLDIDGLMADATKTFGSLDTLLRWPDINKSFENMLQRHASAVFERLAKRLELCTQYLRQEGMLDEGRNAIVDMGWHGTMQRSLRTLLRSAGGASELYGFYYGLWPAATGNRYAAGLMESCFANDFLSYQSQAEVNQAVALLEQLHSAPHGSTKAYGMSPESRVQPALQDNPLEKHQYDACTHWFQQGTIDMVSELFNSVESAKAIDLNDLQCDAAVAALGAIMLSPTCNELRLLSQIGHCATFDHSTHESIIVDEIPSNIEKMREICMRSDWRIGQIKHWWLKADGACRVRLRKLIDLDLKNFDSRVLMQFE